MERAILFLSLIICIFSAFLILFSKKEDLLLKYILYKGGTIPCDAKLHDNGNIHDPRNSEDERFAFSRENNTRNEMYALIGKNNFNIEKKSYSTWGILDINDTDHNNYHDYIMYVNNNELPIPMENDTALKETFFKFERILVFFPNGQIVIAMNLKPILYLDCK